MAADLTCGTHQAHIYKRGGRVSGNYVGELLPLSSVQWERVRDEISTCIIHVPVSACCEFAEDIRCVLHEVHIRRNDEWVWEGPITRIEYDHDVVRMYCEDILWQAKRTVIKDGYSNAYPNIGNALDQMDWLLRTQVYSLYGDPWNVVPGLQPMYNPQGGEPRTSRAVHKWQMYAWDDFDKFAEDGGCDYVVVNRNVYYNDTNLMRWTLPPLEERFLSEFPHVVEYGNQLATRAVVTEGFGYAAVVAGGGDDISQDRYGVVDWLVPKNDDTAEPISPEPPTQDELDAWTDQGTREVEQRHPPPMAIVNPQSTTLLPGSPWQIQNMIPGAWFDITLTRMCREFTETHKLHQVVVNETAGSGEQIQITSVSAPRNRIPLP